MRTGLATAEILGCGKERERGRGSRERGGMKPCSSKLLAHLQRITRCRQRRGPQSRREDVSITYTHPVRGSANVVF